MRKKGKIEIQLMNIRMYKYLIKSDKHNYLRTSRTQLAYRGLLSLRHILRCVLAPRPYMYEQMCMCESMSQFMYIGMRQI